jgi:hypothetical protein
MFPGVEILTLLLAEREELRRQVDELSITPSYRVLTRPAVERKWAQISKQKKVFIFFDIDDLHNLNAQHGYEGMNRKIDRGLSQSRQHELLGLVFSGDEFVLVVEDGEAEAAIARLVQNMRTQGVTLTVCATQIVNDCFLYHYNLTQQAVSTEKAEGKRNSIIWV